jgi:YebC/PmpR family DNA-binding regulatory protein
MSGHSKWANIKHQKGKADAARGAAFTKYTKAIIQAAKEGGGDPKGNFRLRLAIEKAKQINMPNDNIKRAVDRGSGAAGGENFESFIYEGYGPGGVALMVDLMSDNRNRTAAEIRHIFSRHGGNLGESGCVSYMFSRKGVVTIDRSEDTHSEDEIMEMALECGADDVETSDDSFVVYSAPENFQQVQEYLENHGVKTDDASLAFVPNTTIQVESDTAMKVLRLIDALEESEDVQNVYANHDISDEDYAKYEGE